MALHSEWIRRVDILLIRIGEEILCERRRVAEALKGGVHEARIACRDSWEHNIYEKDKVGQWST